MYSYIYIYIHPHVSLILSKAISSFTKKIQSHPAATLMPLCHVRVSADAY